MTSLCAPVSGSIVVLPSSTVINNSDVTPLTSGVNFGTGSHDGDVQNLLESIRDAAFKEANETADLHLGIDTATGAARRLSGLGLAGVTAITGIAYDATANVLYAASGGELMKINLYTGVASVIGPTAVTAGLALHPGTGVLYGSDRSRLYTVNTSTATATVVGSYGGYSDVEGLAFDYNGILYGSDTTSNTLLTINMTSGAAQTFKVTGYGTSAGIQLSGLAFDANHQLFYGVDSNALGDQYLLRVQAATGTTSAVAKITGVSGALYGLAYDPNTNRLYGVNGSSLYRSDTVSAAATLVGSTGANPRGLAFDEFNNILYASDIAADQLLRLNTSSGTATLIGTGFGAGFGDIEGLAFDPVALTLYGINTDPVGNNPRLVTVNTTSGIASPVGAVLHEDVRGAIVYDPASGVLYGVVSDSDGGKLVTIDLATGTATPVGNLGISCCVDGLAFKPSTGALYALDTATGNLLSINVNTGAASVVGPATGFDGVAGALAYDPGHDKLYCIGVIDAGGSGTGPYSYRLITINTGNGTGTVVATTGTDVITALAYDPVGAKLYAYDD